MRSRFGHLVVAVMLVVACGRGTDSQQGSGDAEAEPPMSDTQATETSEAETDTPQITDEEPAQDEADVESSPTAGSHHAVITIGDRTFEFTTIGHQVEACNPSYFGGFQVGLFLPDPNGVSPAEGADPASGGLGMVLPGEDWEEQGIDEVARLAVSLWDEEGEAVEEWTASEAEYERIPELADGNRSQVDSYTVEGNTATGTATFYELNSYYAVTGGSADEITVEQGTFEVTCAEG